MVRRFSVRLTLAQQGDRAEAVTGSGLWWTAVCVPLCVACSAVVRSLETAASSAPVAAVCKRSCLNPSSTLVGEGGEVKAEVREGGGQREAAGWEEGAGGHRKKASGPKARRRGECEGQGQDEGKARSVGE